VLGVAVTDMVPDYGPDKKRRRNRSVSEQDMSAFLRQYRRKAQPGKEPNDRHYSRDVEKKIKQMSAEDIDRLMRGDDAD
jgi:hypothetical protein